MPQGHCSLHEDGRGEQARSRKGHVIGQGFSRLEAPAQAQRRSGHISAATLRGVLCRRNGGDDLPA